MISQHYFFIINHYFVDYVISLHVSDSPTATRQCISEMTELRLHKLGYDVSTGCRDVRNYPGLDDVSYACFCSWELCNTGGSVTQTIACLVSVMAAYFLQHFITSR